MSLCVPRQKWMDTAKCSCDSESCFRKDCTSILCTNQNYIYSMYKKLYSVKSISIQELSLSYTKQTFRSHPNLQVKERQFGAVFKNPLPFLKGNILRSGDRKRGKVDSDNHSMPPTNPLKRQNCLPSDILFRLSIGSKKGPKQTLLRFCKIVLRNAGWGGIV